MDTNVEQALRAAATAQDGALWLEAARECHRANRDHDLERALVAARSLGTDTAPLDAALAIDSLERFAMRKVAQLDDRHWGHLAWSPDARRLFASVGDGVVMYDLASGRVLGCFQADDWSANAIACDPEGGIWIALSPPYVPDPRDLGHVIVEGPDGTYCEEIRDESLPAPPPTPGANVVRLDRNGRLLARVETPLGTVSEIVAQGPPDTAFASVYDGPIVAIDGHGARPVGPSFAIADGGPWKTLVPDGSVVQWLEDEARVYAPRALTPTQTFPLGATVPGYQAPSDVGLASVNSVQAFAAGGPSLRELATCTFRWVNRAAVSPCARYVALLEGNESTLELVDLAERRTRTFSLENGAEDLAWSPSGRALAVASRTDLFLLQAPAGSTAAP